MKNTIFKGAAVAIVTPFDNENKINFNKMEELIEFQIKNDTKAIVVCGTTGETPTLGFDEYVKLINFTVSKVAGRVPVIAGSGANCTKVAIEKSKICEGLNVDGLLLVTPYYNKTTQKGLYEHFSEIATAVKTPIVLYNVPSRTNLSIGIDTYKKLMYIENIVATKEASGDISHISKLAKECGDKLDIYSGNDDQIVSIMSMGGLGVISVVSNILPKKTNEICTLFLEGKVKESLNAQLKLLDIINSLFIEVNPIPVKAAMNLMGFNVGNCRAPLTSMSTSNIIKLENLLKKEGLI